MIISRAAVSADGRPRATVEGSARPGHTQGEAGGRGAERTPSVPSCRFRSRLGSQQELERALRCGPPAQGAAVVTFYLQTGCPFTTAMLLPGGHPFGGGDGAGLAAAAVGVGAGLAAAGGGGGGR